MHQSRQNDSLGRGSPPAWGSPALTQANLPNWKNAIHPAPPKRILSDTCMYPEAAIQINNFKRRHNSHSQLDNNGCISSKRPRNSFCNTPGTSSSIRFQRSPFITPPYHLEEHAEHNNFKTPSHAGPSFRTPTHNVHSFRNPRQLFSSPALSSSGRQSLGNRYDTQSPRVDKSCTPGARNDIENYYHPSMVTDPWKCCKPVIRS
ncbi:hypothetical protein ACJMK2_009457 [Sinanodonta woodiana]|uniref:Uncharacterized protein n=1 Tax=Sinanodonta woodiana TaxID=1069815 RepID=A0ABD3VF90_SINWO